MRRKKILIHSNANHAFTGFGKNAKNILKYLYKQDKYEIIELGNGSPFSKKPSYKPWKFYGSSPVSTSSIKSSADLKRASYGLLHVDEVIKIENPDVYIGIEDIWAFRETVSKPWWNKINCMIWTTLDSLPLLPDSIEMAKKIKHYYCWSTFAEKAMPQNNVFHLKTLHGSVDCSHFHRLSDKKRAELRKKFEIPSDSFITGFVFRNQLRKTVGDLIAGFKFFKNNFPEANPKLLLHTNWDDGWDIPRLCKDFFVDMSDIYCTYSCPNCKNYIVKNFDKVKTDCHFCGKKDSIQTISPLNGVSERNLNEIYNLMDMYVHPFTSGGQEIPIQEAKLTELITAVTNYSCGEDMCSENSGGFPLKWTPYREINTQFIKASTDPKDIFSKMKTVFLMEEKDRKKMGKIARKFVLENYSIDIIGKKLCDIIDEMPLVSGNLNFGKPNPEYIPSQKYSNLHNFISDLYVNMLGEPTSPDGREIEHWSKKISDENLNSNDIYNLFRKESVNRLSKIPLKIEDFVSKSNSKKISLTVPSDTNVALLCSLLIDGINEKFPDYDLYVFCDKKVSSFFFPYSSKIKSLLPRMDKDTDISFLEGYGKEKGIFDVSFVLNEKELAATSHAHNDLF